jgi:DNA primase
MTFGPHTIKHFSQPLPSHVRAYLNDRGIADDTIARFGLGWNGERITIPVHDRDGHLVLYKLGRAPDDRSDSPKMLYFPTGSKAELFGCDTLVKNPPFVVVCEGEYDRLVLEAHGFPAVTGTGGALTFKAEWAEAIAPIPEVYLCFDNDAPGRLGAERVARLIPHARIITLPPDVGDAGDVTDYFVRLGKSADDFRQLLAEAKPLTSAERPQPSPATEAWRSRPKAASDVQRLKDSIQIERVVGEYVELIPSGKVLMGRCCFHDDRIPSLAVFPETQTFHCFGCGKGETSSPSSWSSKDSPSTRPCGSSPSTPMPHDRLHQDNRRERQGPPGHPGVFCCAPRRGSR